MGHHHTSFTPEAMRSLKGELAAEFNRRTEFVRRIHDEVPIMIARFREDHHNIAVDLRRRLTSQENQRRRQGEEDARDRQKFVKELKAKGQEDTRARRLFLSELSSGINALRSRFRMNSQEMAAELKVASEAWRNRTPYRFEFSPRSKPQLTSQRGAEEKAASESKTTIKPSSITDTKTSNITYRSKKQRG